MPAKADDNWRRLEESFFKGHRIVTYKNDLAKRGSVRIDDQEILVKDGIVDVGKINVNDIGSGAAIYIHMKTADGCGAHNLVSLPINADSGKVEVFSNFGACGSKLIVELERRTDWGSWYAFAYRDDRPIVHAATVRDGRFVTKDLTAPPCLFTSLRTSECTFTLAAELSGSVERGVWKGTARNAGHKIDTYLNKVTGKATIELDGRTYRTFNNATDFYVTATHGDSNFALFDFWMKPKNQDCPTRPLLFFTAPTAEPQFTTDFAPCTDQVARVVGKKKGAMVIYLLAFKIGRATAHVATIDDRKLTTKQTILPSCAMDVASTQSPACLAQALGASTENQPPQIRSVPVPRPPSSKGPADSKPRTLGI